MLKHILNKEFFKVYRGGIAPDLTETEAVGLFTSALLQNKEDLNKWTVEYFVADQLKALQKLDEQFAILWLQ